MRTIMLFIFGFLFSLHAVAQDTNFTDAELEQLSTRVDVGSTYLTSVKTDVEGDPYFNNELLRGVIQINENATTEELFLRYNMEENILEFARGEELYIMDPGKMKGFTIFGTPEDLVFRNGFRSEAHEIGRNTLLRVIYDGNTKLVAHHTATLKEDLPTYGSATKKSEYVDDTDFYLVDPSGTFHETKLKRRDILNKLDEDRTDALQGYVDEHELDYGNESDLKQILQYYDSLDSGTTSNSNT